MRLYELQNRLENASYEYFRVGLDLFHESRRFTESSFQASLGNISIAIELLLKTCIAKKCPKNLFIGLPLELELKLTYPKQFSELNPIELRSLNNFDFKSEQFNKCISIFLFLFPEVKQSLKPYFNVISDVRNSAVHSIVPNFQRIDLDRSAHLLIEIIELLKEQEIISSFRFELNEYDEKFKKNYDQERLERFKKIIETAKQNAKSVKSETIILMDETWEDRLATCPICKSDGFISGYCELEYEKTYDGADAFLTFYGETFECETCKLNLFDQEELSFAGIELTKDLSNFIHEYLQDNQHIEDQYNFE